MKKSWPTSLSSLIWVITLVSSISVCLRTGGSESKNSVAFGCSLFLPNDYSNRKSSLDSYFNLNLLEKWNSLRIALGYILPLWVSEFLAEEGTTHHWLLVLLHCCDQRLSILSNLSLSLWKVTPFLNSSFCANISIWHWTDRGTAFRGFSVNFTLRVWRSYLWMHPTCHHFIIHLEHFGFSFLWKSADLLKYWASCSFTSGVLKGTVEIIKIWHF